MSYQHFSIKSEKDAPEAEYINHDGTVRINLDEIWSGIKNDFYCNSEDALICAVIDRITHEDDHKAFSEAVTDGETFNEQDERIMMVIRDWLEYGKMTAIIQYDWK